MNPSPSLTQFLVSEVRKKLFSDLNIHIHTFVSPSAYDTAWLAMIPAENHLNNQNQCRPMFESCLNWVLENQKEEGFWGTECNKDGHDHFPTIDALPATLVCMAALKKWNQGHDNIDKGLAFIQSKTAEDMLLNRKLPHWFILVFPAAIELAEAMGLELVFSSGVREVIADLFSKRHQILEIEKKDQRKLRPEFYYPPLLSYAETLLMADSDFDEQDIIKLLNSDDGSLFQSPSATAFAFMATNNISCIKYLQSLVQKFPKGGVPGQYPIDEEWIKLCMVDHIQRLGLAEHFSQEIDRIIDGVYRDQKECNSNGKGIPNMVLPVPMKLFKDALAFRILRIQGHDVTPDRFCWFLNDTESMAYMQENCDQFIGAMYSVYKATDVSFPGERELEEARAFARKILQNSYLVGNIEDNDFVISQGLQNVIKHEMVVPWTARLDHLNHRKWIEENNTSPLWLGKASFYRLSCFDDKKLAQLAVENYEYRQLKYRQELEEMKRWSEKWGLSKMGFGRDKTVYTYYAIAACSCHPFNSIMRMVMAKAATIVTVADDFYDMEGSVSELHLLTTAIQRWEGEGLTGHSKIIFDALDDFVNEFATNFSPREGSKIVENLRIIWRETFRSWMLEKTWSLTGYVASMDEYLENASISIAVHTIALPATSSFLTLSSSEGSQNLEYHEITKLLMAIARLLNDTQSYQKEEAEGKMNFVHLHMKQNPNPNASIEDSVVHVKENIIEAKMKEFMKHVFMDDTSMPKSCRQLHLSCLKVFHMFFHSTNQFDSETALVDDIKKAIYLPIWSEPEPKPKPVLRPLPSNEKSKISAILKNPAAGVTSTLIKQPNAKKISSAVDPKKGRSQEYEVEGRKNFTRASAHILGRKSDII